MRYGYKASAEQFGPRELLDFAVLAEQRGPRLGRRVGPLPAVAPHRRACAGVVRVARRGRRDATERAMLGTSVLTPTMRYHPSIVAQAFGTLGCLAPGRVFLGVGTGEAMNETPATGERVARRARNGACAWPRRSADPPALDRGARRLRRRVLPHATGDDLRPARAAGADLRRGVGPARGEARRPRRRRLHLHERQVAGALRASCSTPCRRAPRPPAATRRTIERMIEIKVSYDPDPRPPSERATGGRRWRSPRTRRRASTTRSRWSGWPTPHADRAHTRFIVSADPDEVVDRIAPYVDLGFTDLVFHGPGADQPRFIDLFSRDVLPRLRERWG